MLINLIVFSGALTLAEKNVEVTYQGFGAQETVGGSFHKIRVGEKGFVVDVGSFYGDEGQNYPLPEKLDIDIIKAVIITHAHADHIGRLPLLLYEGYEGPIYMTSVTRDLLKISLFSSLRYMDFGEEEFYYSRHNKSEVKPVYLERFSYGKYEVAPENRIYIRARREDLEEKGFYLSQSTVKHLENELLSMLDAQIVTVGFNEKIGLKEDVSFELIYTSHIPGSSMVKLYIDEKNILFSGDLGSDNNPFLLNNPKVKDDFEFLFLEGTYGTEISKRCSQKEREEFREYVGQATKAKEKVFIPAFALDRTQQVIYEIKQGMDEGIIPRDTVVKVYSPTSKQFSKLYNYYSQKPAKYGDYFSDNMFGDIFNIPNLIYNPRDENNLYDLTIKPGEIAIMTSGMMEYGFALEIAENYIEKENSHFVSVSYQDPEQLGGKIFRGEEKVTIGDKDYEVNASIFNSYGFSSHADIKQIIDMFGKTNPEKIFLVHLDEYVGEELKEFYEREFPETKILFPKFGEEYNLFWISCPADKAIK